MANETFLDASGSTKYRKSTGAGSSGDPAVTHINVDSVTPGTAAASLGKAEDAAHTSGDTGVMALGVRFDAGGTLSSADGDYTPLQVDANGALRVTGGGGGTEYTEDAAAAANPVGGANILVRADTPAGAVSADGDNVAQRGTNYGAAYVQLVTSAGAYIDSVGGGTEYTEDAAAAANPLGKATILVRADTPAGIASADGDNVAQRGTDYGAAYATLLTAGGVPIATGSGNATGTLRVELANNGTGVLATVGAVTAITNALPAGTNNIGDVDVLSIIPGTGATNLGKAIDTATGATDTGVLALATRDDALSALTPIEGDNVQLRTDANGALWVIPSGTVTVSASTLTTIAGAVSGTEMQCDILTLPASTNTLEVVGDVAHDAAAAGNPVMIAGVAQACDDTAPPNRVSAEGDATRLATDLDGQLFVRPHGAQTWTFHSDGSSALTDSVVHAAPGAGLSLWVTDIVVSTGAATAMNVFFEEGASKVLGPYYLEAVAGRGLVLSFKTPKKITANTALTVTTSAAIAQCVDVQGFVAPG